MKLEQVKNAMMTSPKGANIIVEWNRAGKTRKGVCDEIRKSVRMVGRIGIEYDNLKSVQEKRENGELPSENQGLPWGKFEIYPYLIAHKDTHYLRLYKGTSSKVHPSVQWSCNGIQTDLNAISDKLLKSELDKAEGDCFTVKIEDITRLHSEVEDFDAVVQEKTPVVAPVNV